MTKRARPELRLRHRLAQQVWLLEPAQCSWVLGDLPLLALRQASRQAARPALPAASLVPQDSTAPAPLPVSRLVRSIALSTLSSELGRSHAWAPAAPAISRWARPPNPAHDQNPLQD